jgi:tetratricopeptide (TPR) repeat protein
MWRQSRLGEWLFATLLFAAAASLTRAQAPLPPAEVPATNADFNALVASAGASLDANQLDDAIGKYTTALRMQPNDDSVLGARGWAWHIKGNLDNALADYNAALAVNPRFVQVLANRAALYKQKGDVAQAQADLSDALQLDPNNASVYALRGVVSSDKGDYRSAVDDYSQAIRLIPQDNRKLLATVYAGRANAYNQLGDSKTALNDCFVATEFDSVNELAWLIEGTIYNKQGNFTGALAAWLVALQNNANSAETLNNLAWLQATCDDAQCRNGQSAIQYATRACELTEYKNAGYVDTLAAAYAEAGDFDNALTWEYGAIDLADASEKAEMQNRTNLYEAKLPYREPRPSNK